MKKGVKPLGLEVISQIRDDPSLPDLRIQGPQKTKQHHNNSCNLIPLIVRNSAELEFGLPIAWITAPATDTARHVPNETILPRKLLPTKMTKDSLR